MDKSLLLLPALAMLCLTLLAPATARAQDSAALAKQFYDQAIRITNQVENRVTGEAWCWQAAYNMNHFVRGYQAFDDTVWLDYGIRYYDAMIDLMATGPDGYNGWIGPFIYDRSVWVDVHIGDAILINPMLDFAVLVHDTPGLQEKYGEKAKAYVELARKHLIEKWDSRGTWHEDGPFGGYLGWDRYGQPGNLTDWPKQPNITRSNMSIPFNKHNSMGIAALRIWHITGEQAMRDKAIKIFSFMRSRFQLLDDHYVWCYWEPLASGDIKEDGSGAHHWMAVHPFRNYQAGEVSEIVEAYHYGIVFTEADIRRIINTNTKVMFNGDMNNPAFVNSNVKLAGHVAPAADQTARAGTLWTALSDFDPTVRQLAQRRLPAGNQPRNVVDRLYFEKVTMARPVSFDRRHVTEPAEADLPVFPTLESNAMTVRSVLPSVIEAEGQAWILSKVTVDGLLVIELYDAAGEKKIAELDRSQVTGGMDGHAGVHLHRWNRTDKDGKAIPAGDYRVRWTFNDTQHREYPVTLK